MLGAIYENGQGVPQDYTQAAVWHRRAADQGDALARGSLGMLYDNGLGGPQDFTQAHMWLNLAASRAADAATRDLAVKNRDLEAAKMSPAQIAEAQRMAREWVPK